jgi:hypothetical protein
MADFESEIGIKWPCSILDTIAVGPEKKSLDIKQMFRVVQSLCPQPRPTQHELDNFEIAFF